jgi:hypothetical protein
MSSKAFRKDLYKTLFDRLRNTGDNAFLQTRLHIKKHIRLHVNFLGSHQNIINIFKSLRFCSMSIEPYENTDTKQQFNALAMTTTELFKTQYTTN